MRLLCILLVDYRASAGYGHEVDQDTILRICQASGHQDNEVDTRQRLAKMIEWGGYYKNLEANVNQGICFVLGTSLSESHWTKLITKSGPTFNAVMKRFKDISLPQTAQQYAGLRQVVVGTKLQSFKNQENSFPLNYPLPSNCTYPQYTYQAENDNFFSQSWV
ncbi:hypothetical protein FB567DRAFT_48389 [Paraphoma chrysanthemicola]|uniref:Uncharacterized protein n=1 Tax=Paraphoma chrysanthemicola TaxID=798071 RepID=A0A8K0RJP1_9PLEO|nr:hypothetical protein FB567DRAFT_48389 [Paraphoma chrysanthemicola]